MALASGSRLNHFEVVALIGEGGMGEVYRAIDTKLHRPVALKVLPGAMATDPGRLDRFRIEARAVAALNHPHIVTIHSVEESDGVHFLAMELVDGCTLDAVLTDEGLDVEQFLSIAVPLTDALGAAHAMGITHRDLKPQNVMFGRDGRLKVLDFGLAKFGEIAAATGQPSAVTTTLRTEKGVVFGTVPYMSPEQIEGRAVDARSDVFSLGTMFYQLATGRRPFEGETPLALAAAILRDHPTPVAALRPALPSALNDIIERCLAKDPAARFQDGAALHQALRDASVPPRPAVVGPTVPEAGRPRSDRSPLVGRQAELGKLVEYLGETADGTGALVLVGGEAGVGKTRLAEELLGEARKRGIFTAAGYCHEAGSAPLSPFVEIIEQMLRELPARTLRVALAEDAPDIARLVPKVRRLWDDLSEPGVLDPEQQRRVLFNAVLEFFRRLSAHKPVLVLLDDLHWADEATIGLLQHLAPHLSQLRVMVLATYRDAEFDAGKPFEKGMATFVRQKRAFRVPVRCLSQAAVAEMLAAYGGSEPPATLVAAVFHQTEGNAFFVGEVLQHLSEEGRLFDESRAWKSGVSVAPLDVPEGVRIVVGRRLARMSETTQAVLTTAAVVGRQFELRLLEALCALDGERFLEAIEEAETARLITSEQSDRQLRAVFSHELIRSTLVSGLSLPRRQRLHASVAKTLETVYRSSLTAHAAAIAHHLYEAGPAADATETIRFSMLASDQAADTGALESGLVHLERALSVVPDDDTRTRATLLWKYGLAHRSLGQLMGAIADWETALRLIETHGDRGTMAALCQELAHSYAWTGQPLLGVTAARRGLAALGEEASPNRCRLLACLGWNLSMACDFEAADPIIREALAMAEAMQDAQVRGEALLLSSWHYYLCMRRREQADACRQAVELLRPGRDQSKIGEALGNFQMACIQIGRPADLALTEQETGTLADRLGRFDIQVHRYFSETLRDWLMEGDLDRLDVGLRKAQGVAGAWGWLAEACQSQALLWRGQLEAARDLAEVALGHEPVVSSHTGPGWGVLFLCDCMADRRDPALALLDARASGLPRTGRLNTLGSWCALFKVVEGLAVVGEHTRAASLYPLVLDALATGTVVAFDASHLLETLAGMAAAAGGQWDVAEGHYQVAVRLADQMPFVIEQAEARYWYARLRLARDLPEDRPQAAELLQSAVPLYRGTGMEWHASRAEALLDGMMPA